jgi:hypothetical protein
MEIAQRVYAHTQEGLGDVPVAWIHVLISYDFEPENYLHKYSFYQIERQKDCF